ncbi:MAG: porin [Burkholderiaceae bacterium]|nr:porin [Burkholderiaceae bacterium]
MNKKSAFGLACVTSLGLACGAASAQNVSIYGVLDLALEHVTNVGASSAGNSRMPGLTGSVPSRLGFRGTEDLGGGLRAQFTLEQGIGADTGSLNQGARAFGRQAHVGLSGPWGAVSLGRQYSMLFWSQTEADILGPNAHGSGSMDSYLPNARVDNSIAYRGTFGAWGVGATYSRGRDAVNAGPSPSGTNCAGENSADSKACNQWSAMLCYDTAQWGASAAIDEIRGGAGAFAGLTSSAMTDRRSTVTGWTRVSGVKLGAGWIGRRNGASASTPKSELWYAGASLPMGQWVFDGQVFKLDYKNSANAATLAVLRSTYQLSKRTAVYASAGHIDNSGTLALSVSNAQAGTGPAAGEGQSGVAVGLRHSF